MAMLRELRYVDRRVVEALEGLGIHSLWELAELAVAPRDRRRLARRAGVGEGELLKLVRIADMCRVARLELAELLVEAGVHTPLELAYRSPEHVYAIVVEKAGELGAEPPSLEEVREAWERARDLPRLFIY